MTLASARPDASARRRVPSWLTVPAMFGAGALAAVQAGVNSDLAGALGSGPRAGATASVVSFGSGLVILSVVLLLAPRSRHRVEAVGRRVRRATVPLPILAGGLLGALLVAAQTLSVGVLGVSTFVVAFVAGQSLSGLAVDHVGLGPAGRQRVSPTRVVAAALSLVAVVLASVEKVAGSQALTGGDVALLVLPFAAGVGFALQQAANGRLSAETDPWAAAWNNFLVGTVALAVLALVTLTRPGDLRLPPPEPHLYVGGAIGVVVIGLSAALVKRHGVLTLSLCVIAGQVVMAQVLDALDPRTPVTALAATGAGLTLVGVAIALVGARRRG
ncbi:DMT family transporter [Solicola sp. PLA-1-18]|uniref:DMT family transporter n=1 Tax=Solicola sp. PLA-1-18 TaxID=3380532 RepID=UPI003B81EA60